MFQLQYENDIPVVYIDARYLDTGSQSAAGIGVYFYENSKNNVSEHLDGKYLTSEEVHLRSAIRALEEVKTLGINRVTIATPSQYVIECAKVLVPYYRKHNWLKSNGQPPTNIKTLRRLHKGIDSMIIVYWKLLKKSHRTPGNVMANQLALAGAIQNHNISEFDFFRPVKRLHPIK